MPLTPMEIHNKEFSKSFRGYNEDEVDQFLDKIVEEFEKLYKENLELKDKVEALGNQLGHYKTIENTLKETLITAQKTADEVAAAAQKKAELIIREAEEQGRKIIEQANAQVMDIRKEYEEVRKQMQIFRTRFRTLLEAQLELISEEKEMSEEL